MMSTYSLNEREKQFKQIIALTPDNSKLCFYSEYDLKGFFLHSGEYIKGYDTEKFNIIKFENLYYEILIETNFKKFIEDADLSYFSFHIHHTEIIFKKRVIMKSFDNFFEFYLDVNFYKKILGKNYNNIFPML